MNPFLLALTLCVCPPDATSAAASVAIYIARTNGTYAEVVTVGEPCLLHIFVAYIPFDPINGGTSAAFSNGTLNVTLEGQTLTLTNQVPILGPPECGGIGFVRFSRPYTFCHVGQPPVMVQYTNGQSAFGPVGASQSRFLRVIPSRLAIERQPDGVKLSWYGQGEFQLQASNDLKTWDDIAVVTARDCQPIEYLAAPAATQFYRYRKVN